VPFFELIASLCKKYREVAVFLCVGGVATLSHYGVAVTCVFFLGVSLQLANIMGFGAGFLVSYFGHARLTFKSQIDMTSFLKFIVLAACNYGLSAFLLFIFSEKLALDYRIAFFLVVSILPIVSFLAGKYLVFQTAR